MRMVVALSALLVLAACSGTDSVEVVDSWARPSPDVADTAAFYVTVENSTGSDDALVGVASDRCAEAQLHETVMDGDVMSMSHVASLPIEAGDRLVMEPGGVHVMCIGITEPLEQGETLILVLSLEQTGDLPVSVPVEDR